MPRITLTDGSEKHFAEPVTVAELAQAIGAGLARAAIAAEVDGRQVDLSFHLIADAKVKIITVKDSAGIDIIRHSTAHLLAHAVKCLFPQAQVTIGPVIEDGFYYDFAFERGFTPEDLELIEAKMQELAKANYSIAREELSRQQALDLFTQL